ncbi:MAG: hypothetical protein ABIF01_05860 [Candidatus Micrarchaeota archaeon]
MVADQKRLILDAWDKHTDALARQQRLLRFSSVADAAFCETFKNGILAHKCLTKKEKLEICAYTKL